MHCLSSFEDEPAPQSLNLIFSKMKAIGRKIKVKRKLKIGDIEHMKI